MEPQKEVINFRTSLKGVSAILDLSYATLTPWTRWYKLAGRRGRQRYGVGQLLKFRLISVLSNCGFSKLQIQTALADFGWMLERVQEGNSCFVIFINDDGDPIVNSVSEANNGFTEFTTLILNSGRMFSAFRLSSLRAEVLQRVACHIARKPYVSPGEQCRNALLELSAVKKREAMLRGE